MKHPPAKFEQENTPSGDPFEERIFEERGELGRGGMGAVREVWDPRLLRNTALKRLEPIQITDETVLPRFIREAQITGQLEHPHIVPVHEFGRDEGGNLYLNMKLVRGVTLWEHVHRLGDARLSSAHLGDLVESLIRVCDAVAYAHSQGVIHCDLKASNVMLGDYGQVYVLDWGISRARSAPGDGVQTSNKEVLEEDEMLVGTPAWMAPEQARAMHDVVEERSDVFAIGALLYFILTKKAPYGGFSLPQAIYRAQRGTVVPPSELEGLPPYPAQLEQIAMKAMSLRFEDRYPSVLALEQDLTGFIRGGVASPVREVTVGEVVVREGDIGETAYIIRSGRLMVTRATATGSELIRDLGPGECFGELALMTQTPRTATVTALEPCTLTVVTRQDLQDGLGLNTWLGTFVTALAERFVELEKRLKG